MLLPFTSGLRPAPALIMLAGIHYGQYGGSTTAILVNIPGESSSIVTTLDGHQMARRGRAGPALGMAAISSFIAAASRRSSSPSKRAQRDDQPTAQRDGQDRDADRPRVKPAPARRRAHEAGQTESENFMVVWISTVPAG
jgi:hypothetical protein